MKLNRIAIIAAAGAVLAVGTGAPVAATSSDGPREREQAVLDDAARRLGTTSQELRAALGAALNAQLDEAVQDGTLTQEQADDIKQRRRESGSVLGFGPGGPGGPHHRLGGHRGPGFLDDVAEALGITERRMFERLRSGRTLAQIAEDEGTSLAEVRRAVRAAAQERLERAVEDGEITQEQADRMLEHIGEHLDRLGTLRASFARHPAPPPPVREG